NSARKGPRASEPFSRLDFRQAWRSVRTLYFHPGSQWLDDHHITVLQGDISRITPMHQKVVDIEFRDHLVGPVHLDMSETAIFVGSARYVQGVEHRGKRRKIVSAGPP